MAEKASKAVVTGTIATVIGGVILMFVPFFKSWLVAALGFVWSGIEWCWGLLVGSHAIAGWVLLILISLSLFGILTILLRLVDRDEQPEYAGYVEDTIYDVKWRWHWSNGRIADQWCYCPSCDATLVYNDSSCHGYLVTNPETELGCENCDKTVATIKGGDVSYLLAAVDREINRRIRTGGY